MSEQEILNAVQDIFRDNFDDDTLEITDRKSTRLNSSHTDSSRMPSSA